MPNDILKLLKTINLKDDKKINEKLIEKFIIKNTSILGFGDLKLKGRQEALGGGNLDLIFENIAKNKRYIVEIQLGDLDLAI